MVRAPGDVSEEEQDDADCGFLRASRSRRALTTALLLVAPVTVLMAMWMGGWL